MNLNEHASGWATREELLAEHGTSMTDDQEAAQADYITCDHHWVHYHPAHSLIWIVQCDLCDHFNAADMNKQIQNLLSTAAVRYRREAVTECAETAEGFGIIGGGGDDAYWTGYNDATVSVAAAIRALLDENNETQEEKP